MLGGLFASASLDTTQRRARRATPIADVLRRRRRDHRAELQCPADSHRETEASARGHLAVRHGRGPGRLRSYRDRRGAHGALRAGRRIPRGTGGCDACIVLTSEPPSRASARHGRLLGQPRCRRLALRRADGAGTRCSRPTSAYSRTYENPYPAHHPAWMRRGARCFTDSRPASVDRTPERAAEPLASLSPLRPCFATRLRKTTHRRLGRARRRRDRVNDQGGRASRDAFHQSKSPRPATSFRTPGSDLLLDARRCCRLAASFATPLRPGRSPCGPLRDWVPVHAPVARRDRASWTSASLADFC